MGIFDSVLSRLKSAAIRRRYRPGIGRNARFALPVKFSVDGPCQIGHSFFAGSGLHISTNSGCNLRIGDAVMFGPRVMMLGGNHDYSYTKSHLRFNSEHDPNTKDIIVGSGAWIGANSVILSGADIGEGTIVGAQSLVNGYLPPYCIAFGQPAKAFKSRFKSEAELSEVLQNTGSRLCLAEILASHSAYGLTFTERTEK